MNYYISNPYLPTHQIQNTQITPTNTSHILLKYSPCHWAPTNILYTQAHKLPWALSQILPIIAHILSNLGFHKNTHRTTTTIGPQNYIISTKSSNSQKSHYDVANSKSHYDVAMWLIQSPTMMWLIQKFHYDVANSISHYDVTNSKPTSTSLIQSPLRCNTIYKAYYDAALLTKPFATWHPKACCYTAP